MKHTEHIALIRQPIESVYLKRTVTIDIYMPNEIEDPSQLSLLLINDGQNLPEINLALMLDQLLASDQIQPLLCVGIYAGEDRRQEYGTAHILDYEGRGTKAAAYQQFIVQELVPYIHTTYCVEKFRSIAIAGFSMGGLSALDTMWNHPYLFSAVGVFSGSLWWRTKSLDDNYNDDTDRIMHQQIRNGNYHPGLRFYFTTGSLDETADRNNNGIIDSIDDTLDVIEELKKKGYQMGYDIKYINYEDGRHDMATWAKAMPQFLLWLNTPIP
jgi:enterochelin esterase-like enzyme